MSAGKAMVVFAHGKGLVVCWQAQTYVAQFISDAGGGGGTDSFDLDDVGADYNDDIDDGVWLFDLGLVDDGPGDWPGSRECMLQLTNGRHATAEEWAYHRGDEWPWEPIEQDSADSKESDHA